MKPEPGASSDAGGGLPWGLHGPSAGAIVVALSILVTGALLGLGLLRLSEAHADLEPACLEGGGSSLEEGICYHTL